MTPLLTSAHGTLQVYCVEVTVKTVEGAIVPDQLVTVANLPGDGYTYEAYTDSTGRAWIWVPSGTRTFEAENEMYGYGVEDFNVLTNNDNKLTIVLGIKMTLSSDPSGVAFITDTDADPVTFYAKVENKYITYPQRDIKGIEWYRVGTTDTTYGRTTFTAGFTAAANSDRGANYTKTGITGLTNSMPEQPGGTQDLRNYKMDVSKNGTYWVRVYYIDGKGIERTYVKSYTIDNVYTQVTGDYKGVDRDNPAITYYDEPIPNMTEKAGIALDFNGTTILKSTSDGIIEEMGTNAHFNVTAKAVSGLTIVPPATVSVPLDKLVLDTVVFQYYFDIAGTIDLSETTLSDPTVGYTVAGSTQPYSTGGYAGGAVPGPDRTLTFDSNADGLVFLITQSGLRSPGDPNEPKNGTSIFNQIIIQDGVNVTLVFDSIDLIGDITLQGNADVTLLLAMDTTYLVSNTTVGSFVHGGINVAEHAGGKTSSLTVNSAASVGKGNGQLTVTATSSAGAGIGGASGEIGGNISVIGGILTATAIGGAAIDGNITIDSTATVTAYSNGNMPAIHTGRSGNNGNGYYVNAVLNRAISSSSASTLRVYGNGDTTTVLTSLELPAGYRSFAFMLPGMASQEDYNVYLSNGTVLHPVVRVADDQPEIYSMNAQSDYDAHSASPGDGYLPVKLTEVSISGIVTDDTTAKNPLVGVVITHTIDGTAQPTVSTTAGGAYTISGIPYGATVAVTDLTHTGYLGVTSTYINTTVTSDLTGQNMEMTWDPAYTNITVQITGTGSVTVAGTGYSQTVSVTTSLAVPVSAGTGLTFTATAVSPNVFVSFQQNSGTLSNVSPVTYTVANGDTIKAVFDSSATTTYNITVNVTGTGSVNVSAGAASVATVTTTSTVAIPVASGYSLTFTATAVSPNVFVSFQQNSGTLSNVSPVTYTVANGDTIKAVFDSSATTTYNITVNVTGTGSVNVSAGAASVATVTTTSTVAIPVASGYSLTFTATAVSPNVFVSFQQNSGTLSNVSPVTYTVANGDTIYAVFEGNATLTYNITVNVSGAGSVGVAAGITTIATVTTSSIVSIPVSSGYNLTFTATPGTGQDLISIVQSGSASATVAYSPATLTVAANDIRNGNIRRRGTNRNDDQLHPRGHRRRFRDRVRRHRNVHGRNLHRGRERGATVFTATPDSGYYFGNMIQTPANVILAYSPASLTIAANDTITVNFLASSTTKTLSLDKTDITGGDGSITVAVNGSVTFTATLPYTGHFVSTDTVTVTAVSGSASVFSYWNGTTFPTGFNPGIANNSTFTMDTDYTLTACFVKSSTATTLTLDKVDITNGDGSITVAVTGGPTFTAILPYTGKFAPTDQVTVTAVSGSASVFSYWTGAAFPTGFNPGIANNSVFTTDTDYTLTARFIDSSTATTLTLDKTDVTGGDGSITVAVTGGPSFTAILPYTGYFTPTDQVTVTAVDGSISWFYNWTGASYPTGFNVNVANNPAFTTDADYTLTAVFDNTYTLTYDPNGGTLDSAMVSPVNNLPVQTGYPLDVTNTPTHAQEMYNTTLTDVLFVGWTEGSAVATILEKGNALPATVTSVDIAGDVTVYAVWGYDRNGNGTPDVLEALDMTLNLPSIVIIQQKFGAGASYGTTDIKETFTSGVQNRVARSNFFTLAPTTADGLLAYTLADVNITFTDIAGFESVGTLADTLTMNGLDIHGAKSGVAKVTVSLKADPTVFAEVIVVVPGDVNRNGSITVADMSALNAYITSPAFSRDTSGFVVNDQYTLLLADINRSGSVTVADYSAINAYITSPLFSRDTSGWS
ncbi:hypothetical protein Mpt1_c05330 [Candidatus Methanoplasma termitum]|uniref:Dockerin domain-containing protein n=1 Tax=Candidatus Methanoplasma termitum TaxID=1577791 RepID=A0A0A7LBN1_9ARCH|nr:dockerin type I domain-containing protein [Candidatus Methanoplasma termitum]AIZ56423.1 hypothetical protein Mpt1_c05330 [Candidatus Methanoplasma termitum]